MYSCDVQILQVFICTRYVHCRQRAPVENVPSASGTSHLCMIDIQAATKSKYYDHIVFTPYNRLSGQQMLSGTQII